MSVLPHASSWGKADAAPLRVLMIDDSIVMRSVVEKLFAGREGIRIAGLVPTISAALDLLRGETVDIILLDHELPGRKGLDALPELLGAGQGAHVVMLSGYSAAGSAVAVQALAQGASDVMLKPTISACARDFGPMLVQRLLRLGRRRGGRAAMERQITLRKPRAGFVAQCIGVGASTGGIPALRTFFGALDDTQTAPILVTQHLPAPFMAQFATQLRGMTDRAVKIACAGEPLAPNTVYVAPGGASLLAERRGPGRVVVALDDSPPERGSSVPGVDPMLTAMAQVYGSGALGVVLTGMGRDGARGARHIVAADGAMLVQDAETSAVWGMPGAVARLGLATAMLPPSEMPAFIRFMREQRA